LFYGSVEDFMDAFDFREAPERVVIDVSEAHIWDISSVQALDMAILKFRRDGAEVEVVGHEPGDGNAGRPAGGT
jgi:SulP family sulfate permease